MLRKRNAEKQREYIERVALELHHNRLLLGRPGDEHSDWAKAEKIVLSPLRTTLFASNRPLVKLRKPTKQAFKFLAWDTPKWFLFSLPQLEWMKLLAVPLVIAAAGSIITGQIQKEANHNAVLKAYFDKLEDLTFEQKLLSETPMEGANVLAQGRTVAALRELDLSRRTQLIAFLQASDLSQIKEGEIFVEPVISFKNQNLARLVLRRVNLSHLDFREADLTRAVLTRAVLSRAKLTGAKLSRAKLSRADLTGVDLTGADLTGADLTGADLTGAILTDAILTNAILSHAILFDADLSGANLTDAVLIRANLDVATLGGATLSGVNLSRTRLTNADLTGANLSDADLTNVDLSNTVLNYVHLSRANLSGTRLSGVDLSHANLSDAKHLTDDQFAFAELCYTTLPQGITIDPNRNCEHQGTDPVTDWPLPD